MKGSGIVKSKDYSHSIQTVEYPLLDRNGEFFGSEDNLSLEDAIKLYPNLGILIRESEDKAKEIIQQANYNAALMEENARRAGYEAGYESATKEIQQAIESISSAFKQGIEDLASLKHSILSQSEAHIVRLSTEIAKKLVCKELKQDPSTIVAIVKKAVELAQNKSEITVKVNPHDHSILKQYADQLISQLSEINSEPNSPLKIEEDHEISPGGCIITTDTSIIDMSLDTRLEMLDHLLVNTDH